MRKVQIGAKTTYDLFLHGQQADRLADGGSQKIHVKTPNLLCDNFQKPLMIKNNEYINKTKLYFAVPL